MLVLNGSRVVSFALPSPETSSRQSHARISSKRAAKLLVAPSRWVARLSPSLTLSRSAECRSAALAFFEHLAAGSDRHALLKAEALLERRFHSFNTSANGQGIAVLGGERTALPQQTAELCGISVAA